MDISCLHGAQQQTASKMLLLSTDGTDYMQLDGRTDTQPL